MISFRNIKAIFKKEFLQIMRDKSVLFTNFFIPLFGIPLYFIFIIEATTYVIAKNEAPLKNDTIFQISIQGDVDQKLIDKFSQDKKIKIATLSNQIKESEIKSYRENFKKYIDLKNSSTSIKLKIKTDKKVLKANNEKINAAKASYLDSLENLKNKFDEKSDLHLAMFKTESKAVATYFFHTKEKIVSKAALKYVKELITQYENELVSEFKEKSKIQKHHLDPFQFWDVNLSKKPTGILKVMGIGLGGGILFLLLISIFNATINTTIGERDQNTYKVLLMNPVNLYEIFIGKYLNVALQGLLTLIPYFLEAFIFYSWGSSNYVFEKFPLFTPLKMSLVLLGTVSTAVLVSAMCFLTSSFSKSRVQAQSLLTFLMFAIAIPFGTIGALDIKLSSFTAFLPLVNFPLITENLLVANPDYFSIGLCFLVNFVTSLALIWFSLGAFSVQWKGRSDSKSVSDLLTFNRRKTESFIPAHGFLAFALAFLGYTYGGFIISTLKIDIFAYLFAPIFFCLGTALFIIHYSKMDFTTVFDWKGLDVKYGIKLIVSAFALSYMINMLLRNSVAMEMFKVDFPPLFEDNMFATVLSSILLFAVIPGFTEEVLFRGVIFKGFRNQYNFLISTIVSSVMFAVIHFSMFKWGHTFIAGLILAYVYEKKGLISCILFHMAFNFFGVVFAMNKSASSLFEDVGMAQKLLLTPLILGGIYFLLRVKAAKNKMHQTEDSTHLEAA